MNNMPPMHLKGHGKPVNGMKTFARILKYFSKYIFRFTIVVLIIFLQAGCSLLSVEFTEQLFDKAIPDLLSSNLSNDITLI
jgi:hypothetical protein